MKHDFRMDAANNMRKSMSVRRYMKNKERLLSTRNPPFLFKEIRQRTSSSFRKKFTKGALQKIMTDTDLIQFFPQEYSI